jgi:uncharacterized membrane protein required for colicin V production
MLDLILIGLLLLGFIVGLRRGFILQIVHLAGFIAAFVVAYLYVDNLAPQLKLWIPYPTLSDEAVFSLFFDSEQLEAAYYRAISFALLFFGTKIIMQIIGSMLDFLADLPLLRTLNGWAGGVLGLVEVYLVTFVLLYISALLPVEIVQSAMNDSVLAKGIVEHTPLFSEKIKQLWFQHIA